MIATSKRLCCALILGLGCSQAAMAESGGASAPFKRSTIELRGNVGGIDSDSDDVFDDINDTDTAHAAFGYWLNLNQNFSLGVSYLDGESDDFDFSFFGLLSDIELEYNAVIVGVEGRIPLGRENFLFARAGASFYDYDVVDGSDTVADDDGTDVQFAAGWRKNWGNGLGMEVMFEHLGLGDDLETNTVGVGITYSF